MGGSVLGISGEVEFRDLASIDQNIKTLIGQLAKQGMGLLLMDEIQALAKYQGNENFVASLRTALDLYKNNIKVIFTGSSQEGLRHMFSKANAPFFHFGQNLPFPEFGCEFTDHLAEIFNKVTNRQLDKNDLWAAFQKMGKIPQLIRSLVERLALHPDLTIEKGAEQLLTDVYNDRAFPDILKNCSKLERLILIMVTTDKQTIYSKETQKRFSEQLGVSDIPITSIQSAIRGLQKRGLIGQTPDRGKYFIDDPSFKNWLVQGRGDWKSYPKEPTSTFMS